MTSHQLQVLRVPQSSHVWYQKGLLQEELKDAFAKAPDRVNSSVMANERTQRAYRKIAGGGGGEVGEEEGEEQAQEEVRDIDDECRKY